jgi:uncharacterized protein YgiB involved in biofilm formation
MQTHTAPTEPKERNIAYIVVGALLAIIFVAIVVAVFMRREPDYALVLATPQDCLRAFDDTKCRAIVARAMEVHAASAPRFDDGNVCEMQFGAGGCTPVALLNASFYAPSIAAVVIARGKVDDPKAMVPLYFSGRPTAEQDGRRVYYRGLAVGILRSKRIGGAPISVLTDLDGKPLTSDTIKRLRG